MNRVTARRGGISWPVLALLDLAVPTTSCRHSTSPEELLVAFRIETDGPSFPRGGQLQVRCTVTNIGHVPLRCEEISGRSVMLCGEIPESLYAVSHWLLLWHTYEEFTVADPGPPTTSQQGALPSRL